MTPKSKMITVITVASTGLRILNSEIFIILTPSYLVDPVEHDRQVGTQLQCS